MGERRLTSDAMNHDIGGVTGREDESRRCDIGYIIMGEKSGVGSRFNQAGFLRLN